MPLENLDDLEASWAEFMFDRDGQRKDWSLDQKWRADNPLKQEKLKAYYDDRGARPNEFDQAQRGSPEKRMIEVLDALWDARGAVEPPPPPPPSKSLTQTIQNGTKLTGTVQWFAVYDGNDDDVPDDPGSVKFYVDGTLVLTENIPPFGDPTTPFWDSTTVADGEHSFQVKAFDDAGALIMESETAVCEIDNVVDPPPPPPPGARLIHQAIYEGYADVSDVPIWKTHGEQAKADDRMRVVDDPLGQRGKVMRVEVRSGDSAVAGSNAGERADVMASASVVPMREGSIVAVSCPIMLPNEFQSNGSGWNVCFGGHDQSGNTQSPIQMEIRNGRELRLRVLGGTHPDGLGSWSFRVDLGPWMLEKNRWYRLVYGNLFSWEQSKGRVVVMLDGTKLEDRKVANLYKDSYCYHKQGWYRVAQPYTTVLYMDSTKFWTADTLDAALAAANANP